MRNDNINDYNFGNGGENDPVNLSDTAQFTIGRKSGADNSDDGFDSERFRREYSKNRARMRKKGVFSLFGNKKRKTKFKPKTKAKGESQDVSEAPKPTRAAVIGRILLSIFLIFIITASLLLSVFLVYVFGFVDDSIQEDLDQLKLDFTTTLYVKADNGEWEEYQRLHGSENRIWVSFEDIPEDLKDAYVAIEDKRFYTHNGVDWKRTFSAFTNIFVDLYSSNQGGSTITQQLVKNLTGDDKQNAMRKIREIMRARKIENTYSKDTILECYLNTISLANGICGVEVASNYYFGKKTSELSLNECAALAAMTKGPELYRPDLFPEENTERRRLVLAEMLDQGYIEQDEYDQAVSEELVVVASSDTLNEVEVNSYFVDTLIENVIEDLAAEYNFDQSYASNNFYNGGYKIYCTVDPNIQNILEDVYNTKSYFNITDNNGNYVQSAMTVLDYEGHIVGIVGGQGKKTTNRELNRAWSSPRQPGSSMKPIAVYAPALENNIITYSSLRDDNAKMTVDGKKWPENWYHAYYGNTTVQSAIERSVNTIPVNLLQDLSLKKSFDFLTTKLGITTLIEDPNKDLTYSSLGLGGCYHGLTTTESAAAFSVFGNLGKYYKPKTYYRVTDQYDKVVLEAESTPTIAIGEDTAFIMNKLLQTVVYGPSGTGRGASSFSSTMKAYAKTGTSSDTKDCWFAGGTPYYVGSCWYGYDNPYDVSRSAGATVLWTAVMSRVHANLEAKDFPTTEYVTQRRYCRETGMVATSGCTSTGVGWYKTSYMPQCTRHGGTLTPDVGTSDVSLTAGASSQTDSDTSSAAENTSSTVTSETSSVTSETSSPSVTSTEPPPSSSDASASTSG